MKYYLRKLEKMYQKIAHIIRIKIYQDKYKKFYPDNNDKSLIELADFSSKIISYTNDEQNL